MRAQWCHCHHVRRTPIARCFKSIVSWFKTDNRDAKSIMLPVQLLYELLCYNTLAIDFWLATSIYAVETKQYTQNLKVSSWHLTHRSPAGKVLPRLHSAVVTAAVAHFKAVATLAEGSVQPLQEKVGVS